MKIAAALENISQHLQDQSGLIADGPARLMGYNSPFVPAPLRYHEVQQPVSKITDESAAPEE